MTRKNEIKIFRKWAKSKAGIKVNKSLRELAKCFAICTHSVRRILKEFNIKSKGRVSKQFCKNGHDTLKVGKINRMCATCREIYLKEYVKKNKDKKSTYDIKYRILNEKKITEQKRKYMFNRKRTDPIFKLICALRNRIHSALKKNLKSGSAVRDLGCSIEFFKQYITKKFYGKMTWNNWGSYWELDHIKELWEFDLTDRKQFLEAVHYTNYQPLTIPDHKKKSNKGISKKAKNESRSSR